MERREQVLDPTQEQTAHFWARWYNLLVNVGFAGEYISDEMNRYIKHSKEWPEGERDYQLMAELFAGRAVHHREWYKDYGAIRKLD